MPTYYGCALRFLRILAYYAFDVLRILAYYAFDVLRILVYYASVLRSHVILVYYDPDV